MKCTTPTCNRTAMLGHIFCSECYIEHENERSITPVQKTIASIIVLAIVSAVIISLGSAVRWFLHIPQ